MCILLSCFVFLRTPKTTETRRAGSNMANRNERNLWAQICRFGLAIQLCLNWLKPEQMTKGHHMFKPQGAAWCLICLPDRQAASLAQAQAGLEQTTIISCGFFLARCFCLGVCWDDCPPRQPVSEAFMSLKKLLAQADETDRKLRRLVCSRSIHNPYARW